jgi:hypothetical protein
VARGREPAAEVAADASRSHDDDLHALTVDRPFRARVPGQGSGVGTDDTHRVWFDDELD